MIKDFYACKKIDDTAVNFMFDIIKEENKIENEANVEVVVDGNGTTTLKWH